MPGVSARQTNFNYFKKGTGRRSHSILLIITETMAFILYDLRARTDGILQVAANEAVLSFRADSSVGLALQECILE